MTSRQEMAIFLQVFEEGTHLMIPWFERPVIYDVRARPSQITSTSGSRDLQMVSADQTSSSSLFWLLQSFQTAKLLLSFPECKSHNVLQP